jgi:ABC-type Mn2+/Zn2+ transport system ATPase subunit
MDDPVIDIADAVVSHGESVILDGVSLRIRQGEFVGVIGPNGAGKTTLLTIINGLQGLAQGQARVLGVEPRRATGHHLRRRIGYVAQVERVDPRLPITVRESVMIGRSGPLGLLKRPKPSDWRRVEEALRQVGMSRLATRPIGQLSGGEYQRMAVARALAQAPDIFLFDEPTASVDPHSQQDIVDLIAQIHEQSHITSLFVTHDLAALPQTCRRLVLMKDGRIWREGPRETLLQKALLRELYNGETATAQVARRGAAGEPWI